MANKTYAIGDIHGQYEALQRLCNGRLQPGDTLILLGDIVDGGANTKECVDYLLLLRRSLGIHIMFIRGNHDQWFIDWLEGKFALYERDDYATDCSNWYYQGGKATIESYRATNPDTVPREHVEFFQNSVFYYILNNVLFIHGGIEGYPDVQSCIQARGLRYVLWDRGTYTLAKNDVLDIRYDKIFIGHTHCGNKPTIFPKLINLDTGAGWKGYLTLMYVDTLEYWQEYAPLTER